MDWIKSNYDRLALAVTALLALAAAAYTIMNSTAFADRFSDRNTGKAPNNEVAPAPLEAFDEADALIAKAPTWKSHEGSPFVSRPYIVKDGILVNPLEGDEMIHPPVKNSWLIDYGLDYADPDILSRDADGDGFTVKEEFLGQTDPNDKKSTPPFWTKLRLLEFVPDPIRIRFTSTPDNGKTFSLNTLLDDANGRLKTVGKTHFLTMGDTIEVSGQTYTLAGYAEKFQKTESGLEKDVSELTIKNNASGATITLVKGQVVNSPSSTGKLQNLIDDDIIEIKVNQDFTLKQEPDRTYKLVDITPANALIQDLKSGEKHQIERNE
ncbi:MAG: Amuc_1099 family pilus-like system protein [Chthoniobacterales bacterium]